MALVAEDMASSIIAAMNKIKDNPNLDAEKANEAFWGAISDYVEENAEINYEWAAVSPKNVPDPTVAWTGKFITGGEIKPSGATNCEDALKATSGSMSSNMIAWDVKAPDDYSVGKVKDMEIEIKIVPSGATTQWEAMLSLSKDIISGLTSAIPPVMSGSHGDYVGETVGGVIL